MNNFDIGEYLLTNISEIEESIKHLYRPANHLFPESMHEIYLQQYEDGVVKIVRQWFSNNTPINGEELLTLITKASLRKIVPKLLNQL